MRCFTQFNGRSCTTFSESSAMPGPPRYPYQLGNYFDVVSVWGWVVVFMPLSATVCFANYFVIAFKWGLGNYINVFNAIWRGKCILFWYLRSYSDAAALKRRCGVVIWCTIAIWRKVIYCFRVWQIPYEFAKPPLEDANSKIICKTSN